MPSSAIALATLAQLPGEVVEILLEKMPQVISRVSNARALTGIAGRLEDIKAENRGVNSEESAPWVRSRVPLPDDVHGAYRVTEQEWLLDGADDPLPRTPREKIAEGERNLDAWRQYYRIYKKLETAYHRNVNRWITKAKLWTDLTSGVAVRLSMMIPVGKNGSSVILAHPGVRPEDFTPAFRDSPSECCCEDRYPYCGKCILWFGQQLRSCPFHGDLLSLRTPAHGHRHCTICDRPVRAKGFGSWTLCLAERINPFTDERQRLGWVCNDPFARGSHKQRLFQRIPAPDSWAIVYQEENT